MYATLLLGSRWVEFNKANLAAMSGVIGIDMSLTQSRIAGDPIDPAQLVHDKLFGQLARRALAHVVNERTIKPQWGALVGTLARYLTRQLPEPAAALQPIQLERRQSAQRLSPHWIRLTHELDDWLFPYPSQAYTVADPLVEYIVVTYGRASVPVLLDALCEYEEWEEVVAAVFAISADQFEAEWHTYLQEHYPIDPA